VEVDSGLGHGGVHEAGLGRGLVIGLFFGLDDGIHERRL
jgi:hypothetical protein